MERGQLEEMKIRDIEVIKGKMKIGAIHQKRG